MRSPVSSRILFATCTVVAAVVLLFAGCGVPVDDSNLTGEIDSAEDTGGVPVAETEKPEDGSGADDYYLDSFARHKHATIKTDFDTYDVRNVAFSTGLGYGSSNALAGYYLNTKLELDIKFISEIRVIGRVSLTDALSVPHRYDMVEEQDLDYIFRTELKKTDGERIEYIVRINQIAGNLQEGGGFRLDGDELQTLQRIVFF